jgi:hypothetical protein
MRQATWPDRQQAASNKASRAENRIGLAFAEGCGGRAICHSSRLAASSRLRAPFCFK